MWHKFWLIKKKKVDPPSFWHPNLFWNFDHSPVTYDLETSKKKRFPHNTDSKLIRSLNSCVVIRLEKRHVWPKPVISVGPTFKCSVAMCSLPSQNVSGLWLDVEEETTASNDWIGCNFKPFRGHTFMTVTKNDQFCDPPMPCVPLPSCPKINNRSFV